MYILVMWCSRISKSTTIVVSKENYLAPQSLKSTENVFSGVIEVPDKIGRSCFRNTIFADGAIARTPKKLVPSGTKDTT